MPVDTSSLWALLIGSGVTLSQFLFLHSLYPILLGLAGSQSNRVLEKMLSIRNTKSLSEHLDQIVINAFKEAVDKSFHEWKDHSWSPRKRLVGGDRSARNKLNAELSAAKRARDYWGNYAGVIVAGNVIPIGDTVELNRLVTDPESLSNPIRQRILQEVRKSVPDCPESLWRYVESVLLPELGQQLHRNLSQDQGTSLATNLAAQAEIVELLRELAADRSFASELDYDTLVERIVDGMSCRIAVTLSEGGSSAEKRYKSEYDDWFHAAVAQINNQLSELDKKQEEIKDELEGIRDRLRTALEEFGFRPLSQIIAQGINQVPGPWPREAWDRWPTALDFNQGLVVQTESALELIDRLESTSNIPSVHCLVGNSDSGKTTNALSVGFALSSRMAHPWDVMMLENDDAEGFEHLDDLVVYEFIEYLRSLSILEKPLLLIIDDIQADSRKILRLVEDWQEISPLANVHLLLVGSDLITNPRNIQGKRMSSRFAENDLLISSTMTKQDLAQFLQVCMRYFKHDSNITPHTEVLLDQLFWKVKGNWVLIRLFVELNSHAIQSHPKLLSVLLHTRLEQDNLLMALYKHYRIGTLSYHTQNALRDIAALASAGIFTERQFLEKNTDVKIDQLLKTGLVREIRSGRGLTVGKTIAPDMLLRSIIAGGHPALGDYLDAKCRKAQENALRDYLISSPQNYLHLLQNPRFVGRFEWITLQRVLADLDHRTAVLASLDAKLQGEQNPEEHVKGLLAVYAVDRELAKLLLDKQASSLWQKIVNSPQSSDLVEQVHLVVRLRVVNPGSARWILSGLRLRSQEIARTISRHTEDNEISELAKDMRQLRLLHRIDPQFVRSIRAQLAETSFLVNINSLLQSANLTQLATVLSGLELVNLVFTREVLSELPRGRFEQLSREATPIELTRALELIVNVDPAFISTMVEEWIEAPGSSFLRDFFDVLATEADPERRCALIARIAFVHHRLGFELARRIDSADLAVWWQSQRGTLDTLNSLMYSLQKASAHKAMAFEAELNPTSVKNAFQMELHRPRLLAYGLVNLMVGYLPLARETAASLLGEGLILRAAINNWMGKGKLPTFVQFLAALSEIQERDAQRRFDDTGHTLEYEEIATDSIDNFARALGTALHDNNLESVSSCFDELANSRHLRWFAHEVAGLLIARFQSVLYDRNKYGLVRTLKLLQALNKIDRAIVTALLNWSPPGELPMSSRLLGNFENRVLLKASPLHEIGLFLTFVSAVDPEMSESVMSWIDWNSVVDEIAYIDRIGRISLLLDGLASVTTRIELEDPLSIRLTQGISEAWEEETNLTQLNAVIKNVSVLGISVDEELYPSEELRNGYCELLERELRPKILVHSLNTLAKTAPTTYAYVVERLDRRALTGKLRRGGDLFSLLTLLQALSRFPSRSATDQLSPYAEEILALFGDYALAELLQRERNPAILALMFRLIDVTEPSRASSLLELLDPGETALRLSRIISVIEGGRRKFNLSGMLSADMLYWFTQRTGVGRLASLLYVLRRIDARWTNKLVDELNLLHAGLVKTGDSTIKATPNIVVSLGTSAHPGILESVMFAREMVMLNREEADSLVNSVGVRLDLASLTRIQDALEAGWALWVLSKTPGCTLAVENLETRIRDEQELIQKHASGSANTVDMLILLLATALSGAGGELETVLSTREPIVVAEDHISCNAIALAELNEAVYGTLSTLEESWEDTVPWTIYRTVLKINWLT